MSPTCSGRRVSQVDEDDLDRPHASIISEPSRTGPSDGEDLTQYNLHRLIRKAKQRLREMSQEDNALNVYRILPRIRNEEIRSVYRDRHR